MDEPIEYVARTARVRYEVPSRHDHHDGLETHHPRGVTIFHTELAATFAVPKVAPHGHFVYLAWDDAGGLLYVGLSSRMLSRLFFHAEGSAWWAEADHIDLYEYATRDAAAIVEEQLIRSYDPRFNKTHKPRKPVTVLRIGR